MLRQGKRKPRVLWSWVRPKPEGQLVCWCRVVTEATLGHTSWFEQHANQHVGEVTFASQDGMVISGNARVCQRGGISPPEFGSSCPAFTLVLYCPANLYRGQLPALQGGLSPAPASTWYGTGCIRYRRTWLFLDSCLLIFLAY